MTHARAFLMTPRQQAERWVPFLSPEGTALGSVAAVCQPSDGAPVWMGMWECEPMTWRSPFDANEAFHIVSGRGRVLAESGETYELAPGVCAFFPKGFVGEWIVEEKLRAYVVVI